MAQVIINGISQLSEIIEKSEAKKILLVVDSSFPFLSIKKEVESISVPYIIFNKFNPNPLYEDVCKGVDLFNIEGCDTIIAVGGGSSIDVAKCIKLFCKMDNSKNYLQQKYFDSGITLIAIPTTAGTGSESTQYAVIYFDGNKQSITHNSIIPNYAILEATVLNTLPQYQKKCTLLDALCQGIESFWSVNSNDESKKYSKATISIIMENWEDYIFNNTDKAAKEIMTASNKAGKAICITQTTAAHAFSYKITSLFRLPHGHAVAVCLPEIWEYMLENMNKCIDSRGQEYLSNTFTQISKQMGVYTPQEAVKLFRGMMVKMVINNPVAGNREEEIEILSKSVNTDRLKNNPVELDRTAIYHLYNTIIK